MHIGCLAIFCEINVAIAALQGYDISAQVCYTFGGKIQFVPNILPLESGVDGDYLLCGRVPAHNKTICSK